MVSVDRDRFFFPSSVYANPAALTVRPPAVFVSEATVTEVKSVQLAHGVSQ